MACSQFFEGETRRVLLTATLLSAGLLMAGGAQANPDLAKDKCGKCHEMDKKKKGPAYKDTAAKYKGKADAGETVTVEIAGQSHTATADATGKWEVKLQPLSLGDPLEMVIRGKNEIRIKDILVGEVWVCSGQSNMQWSVAQTENAAMVGEAGRRIERVT